MRTLAFLLFDHVAGLGTLFYRLASGNVTVSKRSRHLNFFQHVCELEVRLPRVKLPDGSVRHVGPLRAGKLSGFTLLFEAFVLALCREMSFSAAWRA